MRRWGVLSVAPAVFSRYFCMRELRRGSGEAQGCLQQRSPDTAERAWLDGPTARAGVLMPPEAPPPTWNDQRTDEFAERTDENFREVRQEIRDLRDKIDRRSDVAWTAATTSVVSVVGLIIAHLIG
jgi:hypothetical protein